VAREHRGFSLPSRSSVLNFTETLPPTAVGGNYSRNCRLKFREQRRLGYLGHTYLPSDPPDIFHSGWSNDAIQRSAWTIRFKVCNR
jgi:hypothetical protein